eukprot:scaffold33304_cov129-Isochrysis_galbana.AAC.4
MNLSIRCASGRMRQDTLLSSGRLVRLASPPLSAPPFATMSIFLLKYTKSDDREPPRPSRKVGHPNHTHTPYTIHRHSSKRSSIVRSKGRRGERGHRRAPHLSLGSHQPRPGCCSARSFVTIPPQKAA